MPECSHSKALKGRTARLTALLFNLKEIYSKFSNTTSYVKNGFMRGLAAKRAAFTFAEVLIAMTIIGVLAMLLFPTLKKSIPDQNELMRKKSYQSMEQTVLSLYYDTDLYRTDENKYGFRDVSKVVYNGKEFEGEKKFCELFSVVYNKRYTNKANCKADEKTYTSVDNVDWYLPVTDFSKGYEVIKFDVNGSEAPNCKAGDSNCNKPDTFEYFILANGKIVEKKPGEVEPDTYCIKTVIEGSGTVQPSSNYCGLPNGSYVLTAQPASGWLSNWTDNTKTVIIAGNDVTISVRFTKPTPPPGETHCANLTINCPFESDVLKCATATLTGTDPDTDELVEEEMQQSSGSGNVLQVCGLKNGTYTISIEPKRAQYAFKFSKQKHDTKTVQINDKDWWGTADLRIIGCHDDGYLIGTDGTTYTCPKQVKDWFQCRSCLVSDGLIQSLCSSICIRNDHTVSPYDYSEYWGNAAVECGSVDKLPTRGDISNILDFVYGLDGSSNTPYDINGKLGVEGIGLTDIAGYAYFAIGERANFLLKERDGYWVYYNNSGYNFLLEGGAGDRDLEGRNNMYAICRKD